jgi:tetratricopeptide (TPR) repeat protein
MKKFNLWLIASGSLLLSTTALANNLTSFDNQLLDIQHQWAKANYTLTDDAQEQAFEKLIDQLAQFVDSNETYAEAWIWQGIVNSSYAGAKGGLGALSYAKAAKKSLEKALTINDAALAGSAYTSLGILYHKVPGWPIAFGDDDDAKQYLEKAIELNPTGIDSNYFYGEYLYDEKQYTNAKKHLLLALKAPARPTRPLADESRHNEIQQLLVKVNKKLNKK